MNFKKFQVAQRLRIAVMILLGLLFACALYYTFAVFRKPALVEKRVAVLSYRQKGGFSYSVQIAPNSVFPQERLGPGGTYFTKLVKDIDAGFSYHFKADGAAALKATYSVVAIVEAPKMWQKEFVLVPPTEAAVNGDTLSITRSFTIGFPFFNDFLKAVNEELGATANEPRLVIKAPVAVEVVSADGKATDNLAPEMIIPLASGCFKVSGDLSPEKSGKLTVLRKVADPSLDKRKRMAVGLLAAAGLCLLLWPLVTRNEVKKTDDGGKRGLELIATACKGRMVRVQSGFSLPEGVVAVPLNSPEDLIRVADELGKPVIFQPCGSQGQPCYLVFDGITVYRYLITGRRDLRRAEAGSWRVKKAAGRGAEVPISKD